MARLGTCRALANRPLEHVARLQTMARLGTCRALAMLSPALEHVARLQTMARLEVQVEALQHDLAVRSLRVKTPQGRRHWQL